MFFKTLYEIRNWNTSSNELKITALYEDENSKEIQIILPKGKMMNDHSAPGSIIVQVLKGEIDFGINGANINLKELMSIKVAANITHNLVAKEDSIIRLSLAKNDSLTRVKSVKIN